MSDKSEGEKQLIILADAYQEVLSSKKGRIVLRDILGIATDGQNSAAISQWKTNETFFNQGKRAVADSITSKLKIVNETDYAKLIINQ